MYVERYGSGERIYLGLHGWGGDRGAFAPLAERVPRDASFHAADLPGCGSSAPPREWSVEGVTADIIETVRSLGSRRITIVGHCGGAVFGLFAARGEPRAVERVVAIDPFAYLPRYFRLFTGEGFGRRAYDATFRSSLGRRLTTRVLNAGRDGSTDMTESFARADHETARRYLALFDSMKGVEEFRGLSAEVDLVYGEKTFGAVKRSIALFCDVLPRSRTFKLDGARHMPMEEATAQLSSIIFAPCETQGEAHAVKDELRLAGKRGVLD